jgi:hypothetical protein
MYLQIIYNPSQPTCGSWTTISISSKWQMTQVMTSLRCSVRCYDNNWHSQWERTIYVNCSCDAETNARSLIKCINQCLTVNSVIWNRISMQGLSLLYHVNTSLVSSVCTRRGYPVFKPAHTNGIRFSADGLLLQGRISSRRYSLLRALASSTSNVKLSRYRHAGDKGERK